MLKFYIFHVLSLVHCWSDLQSFVTNQNSSFWNSFCQTLLPRHVLVADTGTGNTGSCDFSTPQIAPGLGIELFPNAGVLPRYPVDIRGIRNFGLPAGESIRGLVIQRRGPSNEISGHFEWQQTTPTFIRQGIQLLRCERDDDTLVYIGNGAPNFIPDWVPLVDGYTVDTPGYSFLLTLVTGFDTFYQATIGDTPWTLAPGDCPTGKCLIK